MFHFKNTWFSSDDFTFTLKWLIIYLFTVVSVDAIVATEKVCYLGRNNDSTLSWRWKLTPRNPCECTRLAFGRQSKGDGFETNLYQIRRILNVSCAATGTQTTTQLTKNTHVTTQQATSTQITTRQTSSTQTTRQATSTQSSSTSKACANNHTECDYWAGIGECTVNPDYMLIHCQKSCGVCQDYATTANLPTTSMTTQTDVLTTNAIYVATGNALVSAECLQCICKTISGCTMPNPFNIAEAYHTDAVTHSSWTGTGTVPSPGYAECMLDFYCSELVVISYMERYSRLILDPPTCEQISRMQKSGYYGYDSDSVNNIAFWDEVQNCLGTSVPFG
ncbi:uncharacterized protein [Amphiura filiformis]|uniref:uncharacterized protein n=1 Tax=Amphiura filiformis TaxID=82378 RepID=UPI003B21324E